ncbi:unnamed protein product [Orchesella dallaii]|uniref:L-xylulose reductase n=1 Tax=Orchesella dallaii TaxID=48710 RepID=A0ABP1QEZ2_9HEXA
MGFQGKRIIITGAAGCVGKALLKRLLLQDALIIAVDKDEGQLNALKAEHPSITTVSVDLMQWDETREKVLALIQDKPVDCLINNAGVVMPESFLETRQENIDLSFGIHYKAVFNISQVIAKSMIDHKIEGSIVNISSITSLRASENLGVYCASKASLDMLTKVMACELGEHKIRVNSVNPTAIWTEMAKKLPHNDGFMRRTPLKRIARVDEVVNTVLFVLGDDCPMMNGSFLTIDGGYSVCAN